MPTYIVLLFKFQDEAAAWKSTAVPDSDSLSVHMEVYSNGHNDNASVVTLKVGSSVPDGTFQGVMEITSRHATHPSWSHALTGGESFVQFDFFSFFCLFVVVVASHTFVVRLNSL